MREPDKRYVSAAIRKKRLFLGLSFASIVVAFALAVYYLVRYAGDPDYPVGVRAVLVLLILLNARQNLRQYKYARILEQLVGERPLN